MMSRTELSDRKTLFPKSLLFLYIFFALGLLFALMKAFFPKNLMTATKARRGVQSNPVHGVGALSSGCPCALRFIQQNTGLGPGGSVVGKVVGIGSERLPPRHRTKKKRGFV